MNIIKPLSTDKINMNFDEIISNLPKFEAFNPGYDLHNYEGVWLPEPYLKATLILLQDKSKFQAQPSDIFLCSFPKTGTTWLKALAFAITTRHLFDENTTPLMTSVPHDCLPLIDDFANGLSDVSRKSPLIATHNPYHILPKSINESGSKIVYICREPKDTFTSMWHMEHNMNTGLHKTYNKSNDRRPFTLEDRFESFCDGKFAWGPYWDHVLGFWKAKNERPDEILFLKYEDVKRDTVFYVKKLAEFMGKPFSVEEIKESVPEKIVRLCSFEKLSNLEVNKTGKLKFIPLDNKVFFRKGDIGDWKNHLTEDMGKKIDIITDEKLKNTGLTIGTTLPRIEY